MTELPLTAEFRAFAHSPTDAFAAGLLVTRVINPRADIRWIEQEIQRLADACGDSADAAAVVRELDKQGFAGAETYYTTDNSSLDFVLRQRRGIPISLALVVIGVARARGMTAHGVNFPQHFLVALDGQLIDPFAMTVISDVQRDAWRDASRARQGAVATDPFPLASPIDIVLRMFNNLRMLASQRGDHAAALDYSGYQLLVAPDPLPFHLDRIALWVDAGVPDMARHELDLALPLTRDPAVKSALLRQREALGEQPSRLH